MSLINEIVIDYSADVPSAQAIRNDGYVGVIRYVSEPRESWIHGKPITREEAEELWDAGMLIASNYQYAKGGPDTSDWIRGAEGGREDAPKGLALHEAAGGPPDAPIYVSIDAAPTEWEWENQVRPYLQAWQDVIGKARMGVYCNPTILQKCLDAGIGTYFWEHGWGGDKDAPPHPAAHVKQYDISPTNRCGGVGIDKNRIYKEDFGQWKSMAGKDSQPQPPSEGGTVGNDELARIEGMRGRWFGDPIWLPDVLRLWGLRVDVIGDPDPMQYGHGDYREVVGAVEHHTAGGGINDWRIVKWGRPGLGGPLSQLVLEKDGSYKFIAVGVAWHAGSGQGSDWAGKFTTDANWTTVGIEAVSSGLEHDGEYDWTDEQLRSYKVGVAAILWFLRKDADWSCGHREYNLVDGKIDPAGIDLDAFRAEVQALIDGGPTMVTTKPGGGSDQTGPKTPPLTLPEGKTGIEECRDHNEWLGNRVMNERELPCPDGRGRYTHYEHGSIYFHPDSGIHPVPKGGIFEFWATVLYETGFLGYPTADPTLAEGASKGSWQQFQHGRVYHRQGDEHGWPVIGGIGDTWIGTGAEEGPYGFPQSREIWMGSDLVYQLFEKGRIVWRMQQGPVGLVDRGEPDEIK